MSRQLSVVLITKNAEALLEKCLQSCAFADEIVVVDSGSTDRTLAIASAYKAKVIHQTWLGFGPQKQFAVQQASHDWVLCLDADEWLSEKLRHEISNLLHNPALGAYRFARSNKFMGRFLKFGEGYPDYSLRLFDRRQARWSDDVVHEYVIANGEVGTLAGDLMHESGEDIALYLNFDMIGSPNYVRFVYDGDNSAGVAGDMNAATSMVSQMIGFAAMGDASRWPSFRWTL